MGNKLLFVIMFLLLSTNIFAQKRNINKDCEGGIFEYDFYLGNNIDTLSNVAMLFNYDGEVIFYVRKSLIKEKLFLICFEPDSVWKNFSDNEIIDTVVYIHHFVSKNLNNKEKVKSSVPYSYKCNQEKGKLCHSYRCSFQYMNNEWIADIETYKEVIISLQLYKNVDNKPLVRHSMLLSQYYKCLGKP